MFSLQLFFQLSTQASRVCAHAPQRVHACRKIGKRSLTLSSLSFSLSLFLSFFLFYVQTTTTAYFNAETGTTNWEEMWRQEDGEETQPKFDCRRTGESIIILASFFLSRGKNTRRLYYYHRSFVFTRGGGQKSRSSRSM